MEITLPVHLEQFITEQVLSGQFATPSDALCKAVENLQTLERRRAELKREIALGVEELERGEGIIVPEAELGEFFEEIKRRGLESLLKNSTANIA